MILRKPYAFLIKNFKLIHLLLAIVLIYTTIKLTNIVTLFNNYVQSGYDITENAIASSYINLWLYLAILLVIGLGATVYILLKEKKKPVKYYLTLIVYYLITLIVIGFAFNVIKSLESEVIDIKTMRAYRDLLLIYSLPQYYFLIIAFIRGIGFDVKKFNFSKDLAELDIKEEDSEEFELVIKVPGYKIKRTFRRFLRETKYYVLENPITTICIACVLVIALGTSFYMGNNVHSKVYSEKEAFTLSGYQMRVLDSFMTPLDYKGDTLTKGKNYLVVLFSVQNNTPLERSFKTDSFRLKVGKQNILPTVNKNEYFIDIATPYLNQKVPAKSITNYVIVFELDSKQIKDRYRLQIQESLSYEGNIVTANYKEITLVPETIDQVSIKNKVNLNQELNFKETGLKESGLKINNFEITKNYKYTYNFCATESNCKESTDVIAATYQTENEKTLLIIDYNLNLDKTSSYYKNIKNNTYFFNHFVKIKYTYNDKLYTITPINKTPNEMQNKIVYEVPGEIKEAVSILLDITIRNKNYTVILK